MGVWRDSFLRKDPEKSRCIIFVCVCLLVFFLVLCDITNVGSGQIFPIDNKIISNQ